MEGHTSLDLTDAEIAKSFGDPSIAARFPPILSVEQVAELLQVPKQTVYDWNSRGLLKSCSRRVGKYLRFYRDRVIKQFFNKGLHHDQ